VLFWKKFNKNEQICLDFDVVNKSIFLLEFIENFTTFSLCLDVKKRKKMIFLLILKELILNILRNLKDRTIALFAILYIFDMS